MQPRCTDSREGQDSRKDRQCGTDNGPCIQSDVIIRPIPQENFDMAIASCLLFEKGSSGKHFDIEDTLKNNTVSFQESYNTPLEHTPGNSPSQLCHTQIRQVRTGCLGSLISFTPLQLPAVQETHTRKAVHDNTAVEKRNKIFPTIPGTAVLEKGLLQFVQRRLQCQVAQHRKGASQNQRSPTTCLGTGGTNHLRNHWWKETNPFLSEEWGNPPCVTKDDYDML